MSRESLAIASLVLSGISLVIGLMDLRGRSAT